MDLEKLLRFAVERDASDVFLKVGSPPALRVHGQVRRLNYPALTTDDLKEVAFAVMMEDQLSAFEQYHELDLAFTFPGVSRFRVNFYQQRGTLGAVFRAIPISILPLEELGLPEVLSKVALDNTQGLVLVTGPTGCGKSTTLAAMLDLINQKRHGHIVTIEDPIEYVYEDKNSIVSQREVGMDTESFQDALKHVLREAPDVILIGEMRDVDTFHACLTAAETGHLVFSTLHTPSAYETLERVVNMFPPHERAMVNMRLAKSLVSVLSQKLVPQADGEGRLPAVEVLIVTPTISKEIEEGTTGNIYSHIVRDREEGGYWGMQTMNQALEAYFLDHLVTEEMAMRYSTNPSEMRHVLHRAQAEKEHAKEEVERDQRRQVVTRSPSNPN